uniref:TLC domain-containing protein n=1 Tax=Clytia hemisphaerica TaxID=252671 RepID=A0A7M5X6P6_9CNID
MIDYILLGIGIVLWFFIFKLIQWKWSLATTSTSYAVAFLHGLFAARSCEYLIVTEQLWDFNRFGGPVSPLQKTVLTISAAYFLYDTLICFIIKESVMIKAHHLLATIIFLGTTYAGTSGPEVIICVWYGEFTNMFCNLRYFFQHSERFAGSIIALINDILFFVFFLSLRFIFGTYVIYHIFMIGRSLLVVRLGAISFTFVNVAMGKMMIEGALGFLYPPSNAKGDKQK